MSPEGLPPPADRPVGRLPPLDTLAEPTRLYRLHWEPDPLHPPPRPPRARFDLTDAPVSYANARLIGAIAEVYGDRRRIPAADAGRRVSALLAPAGLRVAALDDAALQKALGVDGRICTTVDYRLTQGYAAWLRALYPRAQAIRFVARHAGSETQERNWCLFLDRMEGLSVEPLGTLSELRLEALRAADRYRLVCELPAS